MLRATVKAPAMEILAEVTPMFFNTPCPSVSSWLWWNDNISFAWLISMIEGQPEETGWRRVQGWPPRSSTPLAGRIAGTCQKIVTVILLRWSVLVIWYQCHMHSNEDDDDTKQIAWQKGGQREGERPGPCQELPPWQDRIRREPENSILHNLVNFYHSSHTWMRRTNWANCQVMVKARLQKMMIIIFKIFKSFIHGCSSLSQKEVCVGNLVRKIMASWKVSLEDSLLVLAR